MPTPDHDISAIDRDAAAMAPSLIKKHKTAEKLREAFTRHRAETASLDDRRKCHSAEYCAVRSQAFRIAIEEVEAETRAAMQESTTPYTDQTGGI